MPSRPSTPITVTLPCPDCGPVVLPTADVQVACVAEVAREVLYECPRCRSPRSLEPGSAGLALLHRAGAGTVDLGPGPAAEADVEPARQVVSLLVLLDQPDFVARLASAGEPAPSANPPAARPRSGARRPSG